MKRSIKNIIKNDKVQAIVFIEVGVLTVCCLGNRFYPVANLNTITSFFIANGIGGLWSLKNIILRYL